MPEEEYWKKFSFVMRGKQRLLVMTAMDRPSLVSHIAKRTGLSLPETSRALKGLVSHGLVVCKNPKDVIGRVYELTGEGYELQKNVRQ